MPTCHPTIKTLEEFCKYYEQDNDVSKRRLFEIHQIAQRQLEARRARERRRYAEKKDELKAKREEKKQEEFEERCISIQTEPEREPEPEPEPEPESIPQPVESKPLETIPEEVVPVKVKRNSFTIPRPNIVELNLRAPSPSRSSYPQIISNTKMKREPKRAPEI